MNQAIALKKENMKKKKKTSKEGHDLEKAARLRKWMRFNDLDREWLSKESGIGLGAAYKIMKGESAFMSQRGYHFYEKYPEVVHYIIHGGERPPKIGEAKSQSDALDMLQKQQERLTKKNKELTEANEKLDKQIQEKSQQVVELSDRVMKWLNMKKELNGSK